MNGPDTPRFGDISEGPEDLVAMASSGTDGSVSDLKDRISALRNENLSDRSWARKLFEEALQRWSSDEEVNEEEESHASSNAGDGEMLSCDDVVLASSSAADTTSLESSSAADTTCLESSGIPSSTVPGSPEVSLGDESGQAMVSVLSSDLDLANQVIERAFAEIKKLRNSRRSMKQRSEAIVVRLSGREKELLHIVRQHEEINNTLRNRVGTKPSLSQVTVLRFSKLPAPLTVSEVVPSPVHGTAAQSLKSCFAPPSRDFITARKKSVSFRQDSQNTIETPQKSTELEDNLRKKIWGLERDVAALREASRADKERMTELAALRERVPVLERTGLEKEAHLRQQLNTTESSLIEANEKLRTSQEQLSEAVRYANELEEYNASLLNRIRE